MKENYWAKYDNIPKAVEKYKNLDLENFITMTLIESGFDENLMENVYINEIVDYPDVFGCYSTDDGIIAYFINERGEKMEKKYQDSTKFMLMFVLTARNSSKYLGGTKSL